MGEYDRKNIEFLMSLHCDDIKNFVNMISEAERQYAEEILDAFERELNCAEGMIAASEVSTEDLSAANAVLSKFMLKS